MGTSGFSALAGFTGGVLAGICWPFVESTAKSMSESARKSFIGCSISRWRRGPERLQFHHENARQYQRGSGHAAVRKHLARDKIRRQPGEDRLERKDQRRTRRTRPALGPGLDGKS